MYIKLTKKTLKGTKTPVYINAENILYFHQSFESERTLLVMDNNELYVDESPEDILKEILKQKYVL